MSEQKNQPSLKIYYFRFIGSDSVMPYGEDSFFTLAGSEQEAVDNVRAKASDSMTGPKYFEYALKQGLYEIVTYEQGEVAWHENQ
ncbi:MAG: hypothetical protein PHV54_00960 [Tolumonas sp.]|nr:hypothetical protein [Tolumonas sp.]